MERARSAYENHSYNIHTNLAVSITDPFPGPERTRRRMEDKRLSSRVTSLQAVSSLSVSLACRVDFPSS